MQREKRRYIFLFSLFDCDTEVKLTSSRPPKAPPPDIGCTVAAMANEVDCTVALNDFRLTNFYKFYLLLRGNGEGRNHHSQPPAVCNGASTKFDKRRKISSGAIAHWKYRSTTSLRKPSKSRLASVLIDVFVSTVSGMEIVH